MTAPIRCITTAAPLTPAVLESCAAFGLLARPLRDTPTGAAPADPPPWLGEHAITLITGPSGSGKSRLLRACVRALHERAHPLADAAAPPDRARAVIDQIPGPIPQRLRTLARAGLGEATLLPRLPAELSRGEQARLRLAIAMSAAPPGGWVVCDECCSDLDRATAQSVARTLARWARASGVRLLLASPHEDLPALLGPDALIHAQRPQHPLPAPPAAPVPLRFEPGTPDDYDALAHHHYLAGRPATRALIRRAVRTLPDGTDRLAGVLVVSRPTLNGAWRDRPWPGRYTGPDRRAAALRLNAELRCISRVIVEPSSRGLGIAGALVRSYLDRPLTPATEALAQMGAACPFFARAGMTPYPLAPDADDTRLLDALAAAKHLPALADREVTRWAKARKLWPRLAPLAPPDRAAIAASLAAAHPVAYAHAQKKPRA